VKTMKSLNEKTRKLQEEYEVDCVKHKVSGHLHQPSQGRV